MGSGGYELGQQTAGENRRGVHALLKRVEVTWLMVYVKVHV